MLRKSGEKFGLFIVAILSLSSFGNPLSDVGGEDVGFPYQNCDFYRIGGTKGNLFTPEKFLSSEPEFSIYPMTDQDIMLRLSVMFANMIFEISIRGTMISIEKCNYSSKNCTMENEEGVKHPDYLKPHTWNRVHLNLTSKLLEIHIGDRKVMSKSMVNYDMNPNDVHWKVFVDEPPRKTQKGTDSKYLYLVQFKCDTYKPNEDNSYSKIDLSRVLHYEDEDYSTFDRNEENFPNGPASNVPRRNFDPNKYDENDHNNHNHNHNLHPQLDRGHESFPLGTYSPAHPRSKSLPESESQASRFDKPEPPPKSKEGTYPGIIVGVIIAVLIIIALVIVIYNVVKKRRSMGLNEMTPLGKEEQQQQQQQQQQKQQQQQQQPQQQQVYEQQVEK